MTDDILRASKREAMEKYGFGTEAMKKSRFARLAAKPDRRTRKPVRFAELPSATKRCTTRTKKGTFFAEIAARLRRTAQSFARSAANV